MGKPQSIHIVLAQSSDVSFVRSCAEAAYEKYVSRIGRKPAPMVSDFESQIAAGVVHLALFEGVAVGYLVAFPQEDHYHIENIAVLPAAQGVGAGHALMQFAETEALRAGLLEIQLYTNVKMSENKPYYEGLGYEEFDRRTEDGFERIFFRKQLL